MSAPTRAEQKEQRFERWLLTIAEHLKGSGGQCVPRYEGQRGSDTLLLDVATGPGLGQLRVHRRGKGALVVVLTESAAVARTLGTELERLARNTSRLANAKRKFVHRLARIAAELEARFAGHLPHLPVAALDAVQGRYPGTLPMVGVEGRYRHKDFDTPAGTTDARDKYGTRFGAKIPRTRGWDPSSPPTQRFRVALLVDGVFVLDGHPVAPRQGQDGSEDSVLEDVGDAILETAVDVGFEVAVPTFDLDATSCVPEVGDCGGLDLPDLSCLDVGDCVPCDCGL